MADIKIFVSHRIDINSELIDNSLYTPMRCGAVFDEENQMGIAGDDTGNHISERRMSFCEFTVQYWAWKNVNADYYGLCHYRRYLSFSEKHYKTDEFKMVYRPMLLPSEKRIFNLLDSAAMAALITQYDLLTSEYADVKDIPTPDGWKNTVRQFWEAHDGVFLEKSSIVLLFELIDQMAPEYSDSAREYFSGSKHRGFNCYVMRHELFNRLCNLQFSIMFEVERRLDTTGYTQKMMRTPAFIGEMLYGIFIYHLETREHWRIKELQLVYFRSTEKLKSKAAIFRGHIWCGIDHLLRCLVDPFFPKGSSQREFLKNIYYSVTPAKRKGAAEIKVEERK